MGSRQPVRTGPEHVPTDERLSGLVVCMASRELVMSVRSIVTEGFSDCETCVCALQTEMAERERANANVQTLSCRA